MGRGSLLDSEDRAADQVALVAAALHWRQPLLAAKLQCQSPFTGQVKPAGQLNRNQRLCIAW